MAPLALAQSATYTYDTLNRLTSATISGSRIVYEYDSAGNMTRAWTPYAIGVAKTGTGSGSITDDRGKVSCGADCSGTYDLNTPVVLTATPEPGNVFAGWSGACSGTGTCLVTASGVLNVTATFNVDPCSGTGALSATITAPAEVCASATAQVASVPDGGEGATYAWTLTNGTVTAGGGTQSITWTAGATGPVGLDVTVTRGVCSAQGTASVAVKPAPAAPSVSIVAGANPGASASAITLDAGAGYDSYLWSNGATTREITVAPTVTTFYAAYGTTGGCQSAAGTFTRVISSVGGDATNPGTSCKTIHSANGSFPSGQYWIDPNGVPAADAFLAYCDMTMDGGGWTLAVNSVTGSEPVSADATAVTGTSGPGSGHTIDAAALALEQVAEIRHRIVAVSGLVLDAKHAGTLHAPLPAWGSWTPLPGHVFGSESLLAGQLGSGWQTAGDCVGNYGTPWYYGNPTCATSIPLNATDGATQGPVNTIGETLNRYAVFVRELCRPLSAVAIGVTGSTTLCPGATGGTATVTDTNGGSSTHQWGYRTTTGGAIVPISDQTATTYGISAADFGGAGTFYLVCTTTPTCGTPMTSNEVTVIVTPVSVPTITPSGATTFCAGGSVTLTASAGSTYLWSTGATTPSIPVTVTGAFWVRVTDATGCTSPQSVPVVVTVNPTPATPTVTVASGNNPAESGAAVTLDAGTGYDTYLWSTGATTRQITVLPTITTTYTVTGTTAGCASAPGNFTRTVSSVGGSAANPGISCKTIHLASPAFPDGLYWLDPNGGAAADAFLAYCDMTVDGGGWTLAVNSVTGSEPTTADAVAVNGTAGLAQGHTIDATELALNQVAEIRHRIEATSGKVFDAKYRAQYHGPLATWAGWTALPGHLPGSDVLLTNGFGSAWATSGSCATTYGTPWYYGNPTCVTSIPLNAADGATQGSVNTAGETLTRYSIFVRELCPLLSSVAVGVTGSTTLCPGTTGGTATVTDTNGGSASHQWGYRTISGGTIVPIAAQTATTYLINAVDFGAVGSFYLVCTTTPTCGATMTSNEVAVTVNAASVPTITPSGPTTFCAGGSVTLTASAGTSYLWSPGAQTTPSIVVSTAGSYSVTVMGSGCTGTSAATVVTVKPIPSTPTATANSPICEGGTVELGTATVTGATYSWTGPNSFASNLPSPTIPNATLAAAGTYSLTVTVDGCPSAAGSTVVVVNPKPVMPSITAPASAIAGATGLTASVPPNVGSTYAWTLVNGTITGGEGSNQVTFTAGVAGSLEIRVVETSGAGCVSAQGSVTVPVIPSGATRFHTLVPCRVLDTRSSSGADAASPALDGGEVRTFDLTGRCGILATAKALSVNVTITGPAADGDLVVYRGDLTTPPISSNVSFRAGRTRANNGLVELAQDGSLTIKVHNRAAGPVHLIFDVNGTFE